MVEPVVVPGGPFAAQATIFPLRAYHANAIALLR